jgi:protein involved in polysaccharide export with SLBB domain
MRHYSIGPDLLPFLYDIESDIGGIFAHFGYPFAPVLVSGQVADPGFYNLPTTTPVATESVTYQAAGVPVSDTYTGTTLWNLLADAGGVTTTTAKNDILSNM